ncbi:MAG: hypothetical protein KDI79_13870 [Anaerolineae bacterium]|nr:hypothetical protein [Anaerolineae bacterium]
MANPKPIGLKELILKVKEALLEPDDSQPLFVVGPVELEITFTVERNAQGGVDFQVVQGSVEKSWTEAQKVKVRLDPLLSQEEALQNLTPMQKRQLLKALQRDAADIE